MAHILIPKYKLEYLTFDKFRYPLVKLLLNRGANINATDILGNSALLYALDFHHPEIAKVLIEKGADVKISNKSEVTVMSLAEKNKYEEIITLLEARGLVRTVSAKADSTKQDSTNVQKLPADSTKQKAGETGKKK